MTYGQKHHFLSETSPDLIEISRNQILGSFDHHLHYYHFDKTKTTQNDVDELLHENFNRWQQEHAYGYNNLWFKVIEKTEDKMVVLIYLKDLPLLASNLIYGAGYERLRLIRGQIEPEDLKADKFDIYSDSRPCDSAATESLVSVIKSEGFFPANEHY